MDLYLFQQINQFAGKWACLDSLAIFIAEYLGYVLILCLLLILFLRFKKYLNIVIQALISALLARFVIAELIRWIWPRSRPFVENNVNLLLDYSDKACFPSGHTSFYFALSFLIFLYNKKLGTLFLIASLLISLSRVFVGIHWLSDILAGIVVGVLSAYFVYILSKKFLK